MDYEDFLIEIYSPLKAIECITDVIYMKANEDWELFSGKSSRADIDEMFALNCAIKIIIEHLLKFRLQEIENISYD